MVSDDERAKMSRIGRDLGLGETDDRGTPQQRRQILDEINRSRVDSGLASLDDRAPEEGLYDRARSLGMARIDR